MTCAAIPIGPNAHIADALASIDCQLESGVAQAYGKLFAQGGAFGAALTAILTIYIAVLAFGFITGRTSLTLRALAPRALAFCLVLSFATSWPAYHTVFDNLLRKGPDQIASSLLGAPNGATGAFANRLDVLFDSILETTEAISTSAEYAPTDGNAAIAAPSPNLKLAGQLLWLSALTLAFCTLGLLVITRVILTILLALGPVFIVLGLFENTRGLFLSWARTTISFALAPLLIVLGGAAVLAVLAPMVASIGNDPADAIADLRPIVVLFLGAMIYAALTIVAAWTAFSLTSGWRLKSDDRPGAEQTPQGRSGAGETAGVIEDRTARLIASITNTSSAPSLPTPMTGSPIAHIEAMLTPQTRRTAQIGIGQKFRSAPRLTKAISR